MKRRVSLTELLGIEHPIVQAPMAGVDTPKLAAAVSNAGALGSIAIGTLGTDEAERKIRATRHLTARPINVNVFVHEPPAPDRLRERAWIERLTPYLREFGTDPPAVLAAPFASFNEDDAKLDMLLAQEPQIVSFHFGLPDTKRAAALRRRGIVLVACATTVDEAKRGAAAGMDAIVAQGSEAGGHRGSFLRESPADGIGTMALVPQIVDAVDCPIIAAGGIADGRGIAAALALGASGVQLGTAFVTCPESAASAAHRRIIGGARAHQTRVTTVLTGRPARGIRNRFMVELGEYASAVPDYPIAYHAGQIMAAAGASAGTAEFAFLWAGQAAPLNRSVRASQLVQSLVQGTSRELDRLNAIANNDPSAGNPQ